MSVRCGSPTLDGRHDNTTFFWVDVEENAPITDTTAEPLTASFELAYVTKEGIPFHLVNRKPDASRVVGRDAFKRLLRGPCEGYDP